ncbi:MAG: hypothetical protein LBL35_08120 [Clostridiales bacterium]|nr:hypothetical protein [Clostridiales bacterium]
MKSWALRYSLKHVALAALSFILSALLAAFGALLTVKLTALRENFLRTQLENSAYAEKTLENMRQKFASYGAVSGFSDEFFAETVSLDVIRADLHREITRLYSDAGARPFDYGRFKRDFNDRLLEEAEKMISENKAKAAEMADGADNEGLFLEITPEDEQALENLARMTATVYANAVTMPFSVQINGLIKRVERANSVALAAVAAFIIVCAIILFLSDVSKNKKLEWLLRALGGAIFTLVMPSVALSIHLRFVSVPISNPALLAFINSCANSFIIVVWLVTGAFLVVWAFTLAFRITFPGPDDSRSGLPWHRG